MLKNETFFFLTIYQLKNTSDCIKIDPPGPGRILKKNFKTNEKNNSLEAVYQLKKTSDCIQIHPPGPGKNLKKKSPIIVTKILGGQKSLVKHDVISKKS